MDLGINQCDDGHIVQQKDKGCWSELGAGASPMAISRWHDLIITPGLRFLVVSKILRLDFRGKAAPLSKV